MVREAFPDAVIVRPADVYGPEDRLLRFYARLKFFPFGVIPVLRGGEGVVKRPVHVSVKSCTYAYKWCLMYRTVAMREVWLRDQCAPPLTWNCMKYRKLW